MTTDNSADDKIIIDNARMIFLIHGLANTGKTTIIKQIHRNLLKAFPNAEKYYSEYDGSKKTMECSLNLEDYQCVMTIDGVRIGIMTDGDEQDPVANALIHFKEKDCHIIICASHEKGGAHDEVWGRCYEKEYGENKYIADKYHSCWFKTFDMWNSCYDKNEKHRLCMKYNHHVAEAIFDMVEDRIYEIQPLVKLEN